MNVISQFFANVYSSVAALSFDDLVAFTLSAYIFSALFFAVACAASRKIRGASKRPVLHFVNCFTAVFLAVLLLKLTLSEGFFWSALFWLAGYLYYGAVSALARPAAAVEPRSQRVVSSLPESSVPSSSVHNLPAAQLTVRLDHALSIADKLLVKNLSRTDRQQLDRIKATLTVLRLKGDLTPQEGEIINGRLSELIKLMSKYEY